jgi:chloramphenicol 3-O phosphotransferase
MVIFLNGTSSSGKTSIARALLDQLTDPYFYFSVDQFLEPSMPLRTNMDKPDDLSIVDRSISGFNQALRNYESTVDFMIVDHVLHKMEWLAEVAKALQTADVFFVNVTAPLDIIEKRESERSYRQPGTARTQYQVISSYKHDFTVDTSKLTPQEAATEIIRILAPGSALHAAASKGRSK